MADSQDTRGGGREVRRGVVECPVEGRVRRAATTCGGRPPPRSGWYGCSGGGVGGVGGGGGPCGGSVVSAHAGGPTAAPSVEISTAGAVRASCRTPLAMGSSSRRPTPESPPPITTISGSRTTPRRRSRGGREGGGAGRVFASRRESGGCTNGRQASGREGPETVGAAPRRSPNAAGEGTGVHPAPRVRGGGPQTGGGGGGVVGGGGGCGRGRGRAGRGGGGVSMARTSDQGGGVPVRSCRHGFLCRRNSKQSSHLLRKAQGNRLTGERPWRGKRGTGKSAARNPFVGGPWVLDPVELEPSRAAPIARVARGVPRLSS